MKLFIGLSVQIAMSGLWEAALTTYVSESPFQYMLLYLGYALLTIIPILSGFDIGIKELIFVLAGGYATEHMTFTLSRIILHLIGSKYQLYGSLIHLLFTRYVLYLIGALIVYLFIIRSKKKKISCKTVISGL